MNCKNIGYRVIIIIIIIISSFHHHIHHHRIQVSGAGKELKLESSLVTFIGVLWFGCLIWREKNIHLFYPLFFGLLAPKYFLVYGHLLLFSTLFLERFFLSYSEYCFLRSDKNHFVLFFIFYYFIFITLYRLSGLVLLSTAMLYPQLFLRSYLLKKHCQSFCFVWNQSWDHNTRYTLSIWIKCIMEIREI